ncbi:MAG TPA: hypothetical protein VJ890_20660 [Vineibacter sp.]|nr:hypothetical protein [Vineibacter sp.]
MGFFGKILVVMAVIAAAFFGWRWWQRMEAERLNRPRGPAPAPRNETPPAPRLADDLRHCPVCDDYVSINARRCERPTCPRG